MPSGTKTRQARRPRRPASPAEELVRLWRMGRGASFHDLADALIAAGSADVLAEAVRLAGRGGEGEGRDLADDLATIAQMDWGVAEGDEAGVICVDLFAVAVVSAPDAPPSPGLLAATIAESGLFPEGAEIRLADGWCRPDEVVRLAPCRARRLLVSMAEGRPAEEIALRPAPCPLGWSVLVGVALLRIEAADETEGSLSVLQDGDEEMEERVAAWRARVTGGRGGAPLALDVVRPCVPSLLLGEIAAHLAELDEGAPGGEGGAREMPPTLH